MLGTVSGVTARFTKTNTFAKNCTCQFYADVRPYVCVFCRSECCSCELDWTKISLSHHAQVPVVNDEPCLPIAPITVFFNIFLSQEFLKPKKLLLCRHSRNFASIQQKPKRSIRFEKIYALLYTHNFVSHVVSMFRIENKESRNGRILSSTRTETKFAVRLFLRFSRKCTRTELHENVRTDP